MGETDTDNGRRLVKRYHDQLQYIPERKEWFAFDGQIWREDRAKSRIIFAQQSARQIASEAEFVDAERRSERRSWGERSLAAAAVRRALEMAQPHATRSIKDFDRDPWLLNVKNGTLNLKTGVLGPFNPADHLTRMAGTSYDAQAKCPGFKKFLGEILGQDRELIRFVQRYAGYSLSGVTSEQVFLFCQGPGGNGKSTLITIMQEVLGDYALSTPTETLLAKNTSPSSSNDVARLHGARMVAAIEANPNRQLDEALIKQITGGDRITARFLYSEYFEFTPQFKLWFVANHPPRLRSTDDALWRRIHVVPFEISITPDRVDPDLASKLRAELPGVLVDRI